MAEFGWYPDPEMPLAVPQEFSRALDEGNIDEVIELLRDFFRQRLDNIEQELERSYPHRKCVFRSAFSAHREGCYNLSVPILLIQADGIWWDKFSNSLFRENQRNSVVRKQMSELKDSYHDAILSFLKEPIPLWKPERERDSSFTGLNRHQILHGEAVNYGNEQNSLKAISLLSCLRWVLAETNGTKF